MLKKRIVMECVVATEPSGPHASIDVNVYHGATAPDAIPVPQLRALEQVIGAERLRQRLLNEDVTLVLGVDRETLSPTGFRWVVHPSVGTAWHDNLPVRPGEALGFNAYTFPLFRRKGLYQYLVVEGNRRLRELSGIEKVRIVIEASNEASIRANLASGLRVVGTNFLLKWFGTNVFSIFNDHGTGKWSVHYVAKNGKNSRL